MNGGERPLKADDDVLLREVTEAQKTITEQYVIARALGVRPLRDILAHKVRGMLSGAPTVELDANPQARNTQFELFVAATLTMGGAHVSVEEPDLLVWLVGQPVGIAAKRVRSLARILDNVDEAVEQIARSGRPGFVALNVDVLVKDTGAPSDRVRLGRRLAAVSEVDTRLRGIPHALGSMIFGYDTRWTFGGERPRMEVGTFLRFFLTPAGEAFGPDARGELAAILTRLKERLHQL